jgi:hypothetical protein
MDYSLALRKAMQELWYGITSIAFGTLLFFPVRKVLMVIMANRDFAKKKEALTDEEMGAIKKKAGITSGIIAFTFAFVYNKVVMVKFFGEMVQ